MSIVALVACSDAISPKMSSSDGLKLRSTVTPVSNTVVVRSTDIAGACASAVACYTNFPSGWMFYNDETDTGDPTLGSFVNGPASPAYGVGSAQISVSGTQRRDLGSYGFAGTPLASITTMSFSTYNPSAGNGGSATRSAYLEFNVDFDGTNTWQKRILFLPTDNGTVTQNTWKEWDVINGGNAWWRYSGATWPGTATPGSTPRKWSDILSAYNGVSIRLTDGLLDLRVGEPYSNGYTENIDSFTFGTSAGTTIYDFEPIVPCTTVCYADVTNGNDASGGDTPSTAKKSIQAAVNQVSAGGTVNVAAGTYPENVTISKQLTLTGAGNTTIVQPTVNGPAISIAAGGSLGTPLVISYLETTGALGTGNTGSGLSITAGITDVTISNVTSTANTGSGMAINTGGAIARLVLDAVNFNANSLDGIRFPSSLAGLDGLTITNSHFNGNTFAGVEIYGPSSTVAFTNVSITNSTFNNNLTKGIYAERLDHATFDGITVNASGTSGAFSAGIDLNLKKQAFTDITIKNSTITGSGTGDATNGVGITIKSRDDGSNGPTSLTGVSVTGNTITGNQLGIRIGEPGKNNVGPTGVQIHRNNISGNISGTGITNVSQTSADATCNWWGSVTGPGGSGPGTGDGVSTLVTYNPWLLSSDLTEACTARDSKLAALNDLSGIAPSGSLDTDRRVNAAIAKIQSSLGRPNWTDDNHISGNQANKIFTDERDAVVQLMGIKGTIPAGASQSIKDMLTADRILAQTLINDKAGGNAGKLATANKEMAAAQAEILKGHFQNAIDHFKNAWTNANNA
jgi:hypothetical protein